ncbi:MAG: penicillin-binding protein 1C [Pseudobdellovibrio sp.]
MDRNKIRQIISKNKRIVILISILLFLFLFNRLEMLNPLSEKSFSQEVYDQNGALLRMTLSSDQQYRSFRKLDQINRETKQAVLLAEDKYFYYHWGVNPISLIRAIFSLHQQRPAGASTITMQMVRLRDKLYTKSMIGKLTQIVLSIQAEFLYSKKQILEAYLNLTPYGSNIEGVGAAALIYFSKDSANLTLPESLLLAVIPQNPLKRNLEADNSKFVFEARDRLYFEWRKKYKQTSNLAEIQIPVLKNKISELPFKAPHFVNFVLSKDSSSSKIITTLDERIQNAIEKKLHSYIQSHNSKGVKNAAIILIDSKKNEIKSWVGSADFFNSEIEGQNDGIISRRSPGSALKPFLYGLAFDEGLIHSQSILFDTPSSFGSYDPENFDHSYKGAISAEEALIQSRNVPAIFLASRLKQKSLYQFLNQANIFYPQNEKYYGLSIALGSAGISALELSSLYNALAHQGQWAELKWLNAVNTAKEKHAQLISAESSFMVLDILKKNPHSESVLIDDVDKAKISIAWKTGTSYGFRDAWSVGLVGDHVLLVWLGNFDNTANPALVGREIAAPLFFQISHLLKSRGFIHDGDWETSLGLKIKSVDVCSLTGHFLNKSCPHSKKTWFNPGVSPIEECQVHREILISKLSNKRLCQIGNSALYRKEVFEFWPSDIIQLFTKYGLPFRKTPPFEKDCGYGETNNISQPEIVSPKSDVKYSVQFSQQNGYDRIPLKAKVDQDVKKIFWFANQKPLGEINPNETMMAELAPGKYEIMVVDDHGQTFTKSLVVQIF